MSAIIVAGGCFDHRISGPINTVDVIVHASVTIIRAVITVYDWTAALMARRTDFPLTLLPNPNSPVLPIYYIARVSRDRRT